MHSALYPSESRFHRLLKHLAMLKAPRSAWHRLFHRDAERWTMTQFKDADGGFYLSRHQITCDRCGIHHTVHQSWPKFNADRNQGFMLSEAHRRASSFAGES